MAKKLLARYRAKREFTKTEEPRGSKAAKTSKRLRFLIQTHAASHLHYDWQLEIDGVFKSWAVTKGPSLDPADKRLAVEVEDHLLDYGDFEGTIPKSQYGGGTVMVWDRGFWECPDPEAGFRKGKLGFTLEGEKLSGGRILARMRPREGGKRSNWLLIRHRDAASRTGKKNTILSEDHSVASDRSMEDITKGRGKGPKSFIAAARTRRSAKAGGSDRAHRPRRLESFHRDPGAYDRAAIASSARLLAQRRVRGISCKAARSARLQTFGATQHILRTRAVRTKAKATRRPQEGSRRQMIPCSAVSSAF